MLGKIHSIETFGTVDGPGIRYVIFLQGCPMRCAYCHNPDTWDCCAGEEKSVEQLVTDVLKYTRYIEGVTVSGGEPLLQIDFLMDLFAKVKSFGLTTCLDTSGIVFNKDDKIFIEKLDKLLNFTDIIMLDIKHIDEQRHIDLTGKSNTSVLEFAKYVSEKNIDLWLRYVLVPTINSDEETLRRWKDFADSLNVRKIELLPYHKLGIEKYNKLAIKYRLREIDEPTKDEINLAKSILEI